MRERDFQRSRVYDAENCLRNWPASREYLMCVPQWAAYLREQDPNVMRPTIRQVQCYVDLICAQRWFRNRWALEHIEVRAGRINKATFGGPMWIVSPWEYVILHEIAHVLDPHPNHGPNFTRIFAELVRHVLGPVAVKRLRFSYRIHNVKVAPWKVKSKSMASLDAAARI